MFVWQRSVVNAAGDVQPTAVVEVRLADDNTLASIFADVDGVTPKSNPFVVDGEGFARFYAAAELYRITVTFGVFERIYEDVLLGARVADIPDLTPLVSAIVDTLIGDSIDELQDQIDEFPTLVRFSVQDNGTVVGTLPSGWVVTRTSVGNYRVVFNETHQFYNVKLTVWDPSADRVYSAMMVTKTQDEFRYRVRSINDVASASDSQVDIEITFPP